MNSSLDVIYVDNHLLIVNKPPGLLTQPTADSLDSLEERAKKWIKKRYEKPGAVFLHAVHRIDKSVSGVVLFARTSKALTRLNASLRNKDSTKTYLAIIEGKPRATEGALEHYLIHDNFRALIIESSHPEAKKAKLYFRCLNHFLYKEKTVSLVEIQLETGRYHQIRAQFSSIGCPIVGDHKYGSQLPFFDEAIALHHLRLSIPHPITSEISSFEAPLPQFWQVTHITYCE